MTPRRTLVIFPGALGDLICFAPALREIQRRHRGSVIELMARGELARFARGRLGVARDHSIDRAEVASVFSGNPSEAAIRFFSAFDLVYSFFAADNPQFRRTLSQIVRRVNFHPFRPEGDDHIASLYLGELDALVTETPKVSLDLTEEDESAAEQLLRGLNLNAGFLLILPGSGSIAKNWPVKNYLQLAHAFERTTGVLVILGPAETGFHEQFHLSGFPLAAGVELGTIAALARRARAFIGNDSGVSHLAAAAGARGLVLFGPTNPTRWRPLGRVEMIQKMPLDRLTVEAVRTALAPLLGV